MKYFAFVLLFLSATFGMAQTNWVSVDDTTQTEVERIQRSDYEVSICTKGHKWTPLKVNGALVSNIVRREQNGQENTGVLRTLMGYCMFTNDFRHPVKVRVRRQGAAFQQVQIRPTDLRLPYRRIDDQTIEFTLKSPRQRISVEYDGDRNHNLFIIPDLPDQKPTGDNVLYYGPGVHDAGTIEMKSGQTLYLDEGALVYGIIRAVGVHDIAIKGRGILCAAKAEHDLNKRPCMATITRCRNVELNGVMFQGSPSWTLNFGHTDSVRIENVKQICWSRNSDGIDLCNTRHVRISNCFLRNYDDNISLKNFDGEDGDGVYDIRMDSCLLWADCAHNLLVGPESRKNLDMKDIHFSNITIMEGRETAYPYLGTMAVMISDDGAFHDITFQNITIDDIRGASLFSVDFCTYVAKGRSAGDIHFRNIKYTGMKLPKSYIAGLDEEHQIDGITFENFTINGVKLTESNFDKYVTKKSFIKGLEIK